jgi:hypothetical protein
MPTPLSTLVPGGGDGAFSEPGLPCAASTAPHHVTNLQMQNT